MMRVNLTGRSLAHAARQRRNTDDIAAIFFLFEKH